MRVDVARTIAAFAVLAAGLYRIVVDGLTPDGLALLTPALSLLTVNAEMLRDKSRDDETERDPD